MSELPRIVLVGGGMITRIQLLPSILHLQREGFVGEVHVNALNAAPLAELAADFVLREGFPEQGFVCHPDPLEVDHDEEYPDLYKQLFRDAPDGSIAVIAVPDQLHYPVLREAIENHLHVCIVKPLVLEYKQAEEIGRLAYDYGLVVGVEYHKRFDYRNLMARKEYRKGRLGNFRLAQAQMIEPYYYRDSNFQNWCTVENSDMFTYVGCHYVDLVAFITGLRPVSVNVYGIEDTYPNGKKGFLWTDGRVIWENGASLSIVDAIGYPDAAAGGNAQGLTMWCQGDVDAALLVHSDQYRGVKHSYNSAGDQPGETIYAEPNPDYYQLLSLGGGNLVPVGYGHRSVEYIVRSCARAAAMGDLDQRRDYIRELDGEGIMATPLNSSYNELVIEAARKSILSGGREIVIEYEPEAQVRFREFTG
jgi:predicted dehydrogenase